MHNYGTSSTIHWLDRPTYRIDLALRNSRPVLVSKGRDFRNINVTTIIHVAAIASLLLVLSSIDRSGPDLGLL